MKLRPLYKINSIADLHKICGLPSPKHPLVSLVDYGAVKYQTEASEIDWLQNLYFVGLKRDIQGKVRYGQQTYDYDKGLISFVAPNQLVHLQLIEQAISPSGFILAFHPDFLWNTPLCSKIKSYDFFGYDVNEALFLSESEEATITDTFKAIEKEYNTGIDKFTQPIIISQIEVLLNYCERFYQRQFITRAKANHHLLTKVENCLNNYFNNEDLSKKGTPTTQYLAEQLHLSPNYLGSLLKSLTGLSTQQHIHEKLIEKAKEKLSTSHLTVSQIAYELGFEHSQSFSKLFKSKSGVSPLAFRASFN